MEKVGSSQFCTTVFHFWLTGSVEILKQPVHTSVAIDTNDFEEFLVQDGLHIAINVKDFKAIVVHADTMKASITARYAQPRRPLQLAYEFEGIVSEFTLMTRGDVDDNDDDTRSVSRSASQLSARPAVQRAAANTSAQSATRTQMPPPPSRSVQPSPQRAEIASSMSSSHPAWADLNDSLFVPADDDRQWDEHDYEQDAEDTLGWDSNLVEVCPLPDG